MRVAFHIREDEIVGAAELGTLSFKRIQPFDRHRVDELSREVLALLAQANRGGALDGSVEKRLREIGETLQRELVADELSEALKDEPSIYLQVDESLVSVPWEMLFDGKDFWCKRFDLGRAVTTPQAILGRSAELPTLGSLRMLVVCCDDTGRLPQAITEGDTLLNNLEDVEGLEVDLLINPKVDIISQRFKNYDLVHFAGHADHNPLDPSESGWHLADGKLSAQTILSLGRGSRMPMMVFSNACRSSQSQEWIDSAGQIPGAARGLSNALLRSGVGIFVGPQWEVEDGQSAQFAADFYDVLFRGATVGMAMRVAKERASQGRGLSWASYQLYGDPLFSPLTNDLETEMVKRIPSTQTIGQRLQSPYARPSGSTKSVAQSPNANVIRRPLFSLVAILVAVLSAAALLYLQPWQQPINEKRNDARMPHPARQPANVRAIGPKLEVETIAGRAVPTTLLALAQKYQPLSRCLASVLQASERFRLIPASRAKELAEDQGLNLDSGLTRSDAARLGREIGAEIVVHTGKSGKTLRAVDPLTKEVLVARPLPRVRNSGSDGAAKKVCGTWLGHLRRVVHGEGKAVSVNQTPNAREVTVNIGWRSRITPGSVLDVVHADGRRSELKVVRVELDRSVAVGDASVGDKVIRRHAPPQLPNP